MSFFRYPGGKKKLSNRIVSRINGILDADQSIVEYREPFFGGGSIGLSLLGLNPCVDHVWINDIDIGLSSLWTSVLKYPEDLKKQVMFFIPSVEAFYSFKSSLTIPLLVDSQSGIVDAGFKKLAIHQISYSGLGTKSGGPLGGQAQESKYKVDCRWSPTYICKKIDKLHLLLANREIKTGGCSSFDFETLVNNEDAKAVIYLDPPYYIKGNDLYQCSFSEGDHLRLSKALQKTSHKWLLSYDDCPEIRNLYSWAKVEDLTVNYSITGSRSKNELLIHSGIKC